MEKKVTRGRMLRGIGRREEEDDEGEEDGMKEWAVGLRLQAIGRRADEYNEEYGKRRWV